jgi:hypothetical protein
MARLTPRAAGLRIDALLTVLKTRGPPMPSESFSPGSPPGLPPVAPPSGKFIVQLFLVPGLIVGVIVCVLLLFNWLFAGPRSPEAILLKLDNPNTEVRWRAAADLADVLKRDEQLASNAEFAFGLADRAERARESAEPAEKSLEERSASLTPEQALAEAAKLEPERNYLQYLCACLGNLRVPAGVSVLQKLAEQETGVEPKALAARRRQAVWALADLGQNLRRFDEAKQPDQDVMIAGVDRLADDSSRGIAAGKLAKQFQDRRAGRPSALGVDTTLAKCATARDSFLRELTALALNFWDGSAAENERMEATLLKLGHDDGREEDRVAAGSDQPPNSSQSIVKSPGLRVRFNAVAALARRGSKKTRLDQLDEMLDGGRLRELCVVRQPDGVEQPDELFAMQTQIAALQAVAELHRRAPALDLSEIRAAVNKLADDPNSAVRAQARSTRDALDK